MEFTFSLTLLLCITLSYFLLRRRRLSKHAPGPFPYPIIGNLLQLGPSPHRSLAKLSLTHGPLMHLKLGSVHTIVVSSPEIAQSILQHHDHVFPGRMATVAAKSLHHHLSSVACLPVGRQWRTLRKLCREQMFSTSRLDAGRAMRQQKLQQLLGFVEACSADRRVVDVGEAAFVTSLNLISNTLFSDDFAGYDEGESREVMEMVRGLMGAFGRFNAADYFGFLGGFDPQGIRREAEGYMGRLLAVFDGIVDRRKAEFEERSDMLEALIGRESQSELSSDDVKHLLLDLFVAGTDTTSSTVEWAMTELLRNPKILSKAKLELQTILGDNKQLLEESDISKLPYLQAVIKETLRYHPPGPFIARQKDENDLEISGYIVPKNTVVFVNIWAIHRDSRIWSDPDSFNPDRFLKCEIDVKGQNFKLIPFGAGRRMCPGIPLAYRMVHLMVASLIHNFDWKIENGVRREEVDVSEKFGLSLQKALPLNAIPIKL